MWKMRAAHGRCPAPARRWRSSASREEVRELLPQVGAQLGANVHYLGEGAGELLVVGNAGVDQDAIVEVAGQVERIALRGPRLVDDVDVGRRIEARAHRPQHLVEVARVDVLV